ncbi:MAG: phosphotransferase [Spiribacter sp.]|nr:phosphotransferase [Spiribacter sp.]
MVEDARQRFVANWLVENGFDPASLVALGADASARRYFRLQTPAGGRVVMDAPDQVAVCEAYLRVRRLMEAAGVHVPAVDRADAQAGVMVIEDLGGTDYLAALRRGEPAEPLLDDALVALVRWQAATASAVLPAYDADRLQAELDLFPTWYVRQHLGLEPDTQWWAEWRSAGEGLILAATKQPQVAVHRDFMARNLLVSQPNPGVIDFQDALTGPVTYDLVSLLRDAFFDFPPAAERAFIARYEAAARAAGIALPDPLDEAIDLMGAQRHLKVLGIFARLAYRDDKPGYLDDAPRFLAYLARELAPYPAYAGLRAMLDALPVKAARA